MSAGTPIKNIEGLRQAFRDLGDGSYARVVVAMLEEASQGGSSSLGSPTDAAWDGQASSASLIAIMKAVHAQLVAINQNTGT
jgi:hypothetical protein